MTCPADSLPQVQVNEDKAVYHLRAAALAAGFPNVTAASTVNRLCSSGLKAIQDIANQISNGSIECGIAIGAESMSAPSSNFTLHPDVLQTESKDSSAPNDALDCLQPMGQTSENVGNDFNVTRQSQDQFAAESYIRAEKAQKEGWSDDEIFPFTTTVKDPKTGEEKKVTLTRDEGPRWGTTYESLSKIRPAFPDYGDKSTGGNSSQVTDGGGSSP